jgi:phosphomannomutase
MCASTVSSKLLAEIAHKEGFRFEETLTGFKWIGARAAKLTREEGYRNLFCYEEAIGYCCGDVIFDKDGISAMAVFAELACWAYRHGSTLTQHLQSIYDNYGEFASHNGYFILKDPAVINVIMNHIRQEGKYNVDLSPYQVESIRDLGVPSYDSTTEDKKPTLPTSKSSPMITLRFTNGCVAQFRASGTEPKFKYYIELKGKPGVPRETVANEVRTMAELILEKLLEPGKNGLV